MARQQGEARRILVRRIILGAFFLAVLINAGTGQATTLALTLDSWRNCDWRENIFIELDHPLRLYNLGWNYRSEARYTLQEEGYFAFQLSCRQECSLRITEVYYPLNAPGPDSYTAEVWIENTGLRFEWVADTYPSFLFLEAQCAVTFLLDGQEIMSWSAPLIPEFLRHEYEVEVVGAPAFRVGAFTIPISYTTTDDPNDEMPPEYWPFGQLTFDTEFVFTFSGYAVLDIPPSGHTPVPPALYLTAAGLATLALLRRKRG